MHIRRQNGSENAQENREKKYGKNEDMSLQLFFV